VFDGECADGTVVDCSGDGDCCSETWIGDGLCDGADQSWGCDLSCYDNDGGDCDAFSSNDHDDDLLAHAIRKMSQSGQYDLNVLNQLGMFDDQTREWILISTTVETSMTIIGVTPDEEITFGVTASNVAGESEMSTATSAGGAPEVTLDTPTDMSATGATEDFDGDGVDDHAITWTWTDSNEAEGCANGSSELVDCVGTAFCNDQCGAATGYDSCLPTDGDVNGDGTVSTWIGDGFCDDGSWGLVFTCDEYSNDCGDCDDGGDADPNDWCGDIPVSCDDAS
jgi:hypothetical protein